MEQPNISPETENKSENINQEDVEKIAKALESFSPNPDVILLEEAVIASSSRLAELHDKSTTRVKAILGAMLFAVTMQASAGQESQSVEKAETELSFSQTMEVKEKIKEITGIDIVAEAKKVNREVKLYTPEKPATRTIVNLGQTHNFTQKINWDGRTDVSESQKSIAKFLTSVATPQTKVFVEGFHTDEKDNLDDYRLFGDLVKKMDSSDEVFDVWRKFPDIDISTKDKIIGEKLISMGFIEIETLKYKKGDKEILLPSTGVFPVEHSKEVSSDVELNITSSSLVLQAKGVIDFQPAEKFLEEGCARQKLDESVSILNKKAEHLKEVLGNFGADFSKGINTSSFSINYKANINQEINNGLLGIDLAVSKSNFIHDLAGKSFCKENVECKKIVTEMIEKDIPEAHKAVIDDREDEAIELIAEQSKSGEVSYLVYGSAHDFTRAVKKWNYAHPEQRFNLVTVKSQKYF